MHSRNLGPAKTIASSVYHLASWKQVRVSEIMEAECWPELRNAFPFQKTRLLVMSK